MAKYASNWIGITATAVADSTNFTDSGYPLFLQGGNSTQRLVISEIYIGGEESSTSNPTSFVVARDSTVGATGIGGARTTLLDGSATAPGTVAVVGNSSTTKPQRSTSYLLSPSMNAYGGIVRWVPAPGNELIVVGNGTSFGEISLSSRSGTGKTSGHFLYEIA